MEALPEDLVHKCLLGVSYKYHANLKAVCRRWEAMVSNPNFYAHRKISGTSEELICLIRIDWSSVAYTVTLYDPQNGTRQSLPPIDEPQFRGIPIWCQCVAVNQKLVLMGGLHPPVRTGLLKSVYIYDFVSARWSRGADMPTPRIFFACSVCSSSGVIYVAGGNDENNRPLASAEFYNVEEDRWENLPSMAQPHGYGCQAVLFQGKFMVVWGHEFDISAEVFDPTAGTWRRCEDMWSLGERPMERGSVIATCSGDLYVFLNRDIMKYDVHNNIWTAVANIQFPTFLVFY